MAAGASRTILVLLCLCGTLLAAGPTGVWLDVPFVKQEKNGCGAASIAMVMQYWLKQQEKPEVNFADAAEIQRALYSKEGHGIYASALEQYFKQHGFRTFAFQGAWQDFKTHLEKGRPLIVALKPAGLDPSLHYVVITGVDWEHNMVMVNDPAQRKLLKLDRPGFEKQWSATGNWTLLALPDPQAR